MGKPSRFVVCYTTLAITALLRSIKSTRIAKKNAIARRRDKSRL